MLTKTRTSVASLFDEQQGLLGTRRAAHLLRRCSFYFCKERVDELAGKTATEAVDLLFDDASPMPYMDKPLFADNIVDPQIIHDWIDDDSFTTSSNDTRRRRAVVTWWLRNAIFDPTAHHKCAFFLHTTFTTGFLGISVTGFVNGVNQNLNREISRFVFDHLRLLN